MRYFSVVGELLKMLFHQWRRFVSCKGRQSRIHVEQELHEAQRSWGAHRAIGERIKQALLQVYRKAWGPSGALSPANAPSFSICFRTPLAVRGPRWPRNSGSLGQALQAGEGIRRSFHSSACRGQYIILGKVYAKRPQLTQLRDFPPLRVV